MPYLLEIPLTRQEWRADKGGGETPRALNAMVYHWLDAADKRIVEFVHDRAVKLKPFTVSPLVRLREGEYVFRATLLEDEYGAFVSDGIEHALREMPRGGYSVRVGQEILRVAEAPRVWHTSYAELKDNARHDLEIALEFLSPTSFHVNGMDYALPEPRRVFESYLKRWNEFSGWVLEPAEALLDWVTQNVALAFFEIHSAEQVYREYKHIGCVGGVTYCVQKNGWGDADKVHWLNVLAEYATFCGTGRKTTQGMGQTRRVANRRTR